MKDFAEHLQDSLHNIQNLRQDLIDNPIAKDVIQANLPFDLPCSADKKHKIGILFLHGLLGSPFCMQELAQGLHAQDYWVRSILLSGHGTHPSQLINTKAEDWIQLCQEAVTDFKNSVDEIWLLGFSGGASIALYHALEEANIKGLILLAPSLRLKNKFAFATPLVNPYISYLKKYQWLEKTDDTDISKYTYFPFNLAVQAYRLTKLLKKSRKKPLKTPLMIIASEEDETVSFKAITKYFKKQAKQNDKLIIYSKTLKKSENKQIDYRISHYDKLKILDFSHVALTFSQTNFYYGEEGVYQGRIYTPLKPISNIIYKGALSKFNRKTYRLRRLTYNPDFAHMLTSIQNFIREHA